MDALLLLPRSASRALAGAVLATGCAVAPAAAEPVDLQLILAIDCSYSVDSTEFRQQMQGTAAALRDPEVIAAIENGPRGRIAVSLVQWAGNDQQHVTLPWRRIGNAAEARAVAEAIAALPRATADGATSVSAMMRFGVSHFARGPYRGDRRVIDVSSDGRNNFGPVLSLAREFVATQDVTVNGLAITNEIPTLHQYYEQQVIVGLGAFVVRAANYADYARAIRIKLLKEIGYDAVAGAASSARTLTAARR